MFLLGVLRSHTFCDEREVFLRRWLYLHPTYQTATLGVFTLVPLNAALLCVDLTPSCRIVQIN
jgi:hypothetical protein